MKDLAATTMAAALKQREQIKPYIRLLEVTLGGGEVLRVANFDTDVVFETNGDGRSLVWQRFPFAFGDITETKRGDLPQIQIGVCNVTLELMSRIDASAGLTGEKVRLLIVSAGSLSDSGARVLFTGEIIHAEVTQDTAVFDLGRPNLNQAVFPARRVLSQCSVVQFGDSDCGYIIPPSPTEAVGGGFSTCARHLNACRLRGDDEEARGLVRLHPRRFDGAPGTAIGNP